MPEFLQLDQVAADRGPVLVNLAQIKAIEPYPSETGTASRIYLGGLHFVVKTSFTDLRGMIERIAIGR